MSRPHRAAAAAAVIALAAWAPPAGAEVLSLSEVYALGEHVACVADCGAAPELLAPYPEHVAWQECVVACGEDPAGWTPPPRQWEKNGVWPIDAADHELALLEYQHWAPIRKAQEEGKTPEEIEALKVSMTKLLCYADAPAGEVGTIVIPAALCAGGVCQAMTECTEDDCAADVEVEVACQEDDVLGPVCWWPDDKRPAACPDVVCEASPVHTLQECADEDGDGVPVWLEEHLGSDPGVADPPCSTDWPCSFDQACVYDPALASGSCEARACEGECTAFHLALVAQDDQEVLLHVYYDFTPVPARVLDLYVEYDQAALTLQDSRGLAPLALQGKELATTHLSDGTLRLSVFDTGGTHPVPTGPIVELVFRRHTQDATEVAFTTEDALQVKAVAPLQGNSALQAELKKDALWGPPVVVPPLDQVTTWLRLWYGFDAGSAALSYANVPSADELCGAIADCAGEEDEVRKGRFVDRLAELQAGLAVGGEEIGGLSGAARYLDGWADHLRLPVHYAQPLTAAAQSFSASTWFYGEGNSQSELKKSPQILLSHLTFSERTRFGLLLKPAGGDELTLVFFVGDMLGKAPAPVEVEIATGIDERTWHHAGFTLDANSGVVDLYFDGERVTQAQVPQPPAAIACPQFFAATDVQVHEEGEVLGGRPPERVYLAVEQSGRYRVQRMDPAGLGAVELLSDPEYSFKDPDYSPVVDKLVYSANITGDFEIWLADGDGSNQRQLTAGFGDAARAITARRPRWAPDATGVVFDSNIFSVLPEDNDFARVRHLYYIGYDPAADAIAIEGPSGATVEQLDYAALLAAQSVGDYRPTGGAQDRHHWGARWLTGADPDTGSPGELVMAIAEPGFGGGDIRRLTLADPLNQSQAAVVPGLGGAEHVLRLLAARRGATDAVLQPEVAERLLYERSSSVFEGSDQFALSASQGAVTVTHEPSGYAPDCWDANGDGLAGADEDRDGDGDWDQDDCYPHEVRNLYVAFDASAWTPALEDADGLPQALGAALDALGKSLELRTVYAGGEAFVRVEVRSPLDATPIADGAEVVTLTFVAVQGVEPTVAFEARRRLGVTEVLVKDLLSTAGAVALTDPDGLFESIDDAAFSPDAGRLLLSATSQSAPALLRTLGATTAQGAEKLLLEPVAVRGMAWARRDGLMACNWIGGYQHPQSKAIQWGLRGGLDDLKIHSGLRDPDAFRSEAERGHAFLEAAGLGGAVESKLPSCTTDHLECPPYHLCVGSQCVMLPCEPDHEPQPGDGLFWCADYQSQCTQRPLAVEQEFTGGQGQDSYEWVCAAECSTDPQCYEKECKNGPCRYCDPVTRSCLECREEIQLLGELSVVAIEGCPDANSFRCEAGTCVTDCYALTDEQSAYLCDPALEYCEQGQCVLHDWTWWDLAPASFGGGPPSRREVPKDPASGWHGYTQSVDQRIPIAVTAYGVADYGAPPEVIVEARGGPFYGGDWHRIGEAVVQARTAAEAELAPVTLSSPWVFDSLRLRLVSSPYDNVGAAGTGLGTGDEDFCLAELEAAFGEAADPAVCYRRAQGSVHHLGYRSELPWHEAIAACVEHGSAGCPATGAGGHDYLWGGHPAAVVLEVLVDGGSVMNAITEDTVCAYGDYGAAATTPWTADGPKKVLYGDISTEQSPAKEALCAADPDACASPGAAGLVEFPHDAKGFALLNCNVYDPAKGGETAAAVFQGIPIVKPWPATAGVIVQDTGDTCLMQVEPPLTTPCYAWQDDKVSLDPNLSLVSKGDYEPLGLVQFGYLTGFGHDGGFTPVPLPVYPLTVKVTGHTAGGLEIDCGGGSAAVGVGGEVTITTCPDVKEGKQVVVEVTTQPTSADQTCTVAVDPALQTGGMPAGGTTVQVYCDSLYPVGGTVTGHGGGLLQLLGVLSFDGVATAAKEVVHVGEEGPFTFATLLPEGGSYQVSVKSHPEGQLCTVEVGASKTTMPAQGVDTILVSCETAQPHDLKVQVTGLTGAGLELLEAKTGATLAPPPSAGAASYAFPVQLFYGDPYQIKITAQPADALLSCKIDGTGDGGVLDGVMPDADTIGATVTCATLPTWKVPVKVSGLVGDGLSLRLNGAEVLPISAPASASDQVAATFQTPLTKSTPWTVQVYTQPTGPAQVCSVVPSTASGVIGSANAPEVLVTCQPPDPIPVLYKVGGTISGLKGAGLELEFGYGAQTVEVQAADTTFTFPDPVPGDTPYHVEVAKHPTSPTQKCTVDKADGEVKAKDVDDIAITCTDAVWITVEIARDGSDGAHVRARLFSSGTLSGTFPFQVPVAGKLVAIQPDKAKVKSGKAVFLLADTEDDDEPAAVAPGTYYLFVELNHDNDYDAESGDPLFDPGDFGAYRKVTASASAAAVVTLKHADFAPLVAADLAASGDFFSGLWEWEAGDLRCWWTPYGVGGFTGMPPGPLAPVVATSTVPCLHDTEDPDSGDTIDGCFDQLPLGDNADYLFGFADPPTQFATKLDAVVPSATYDITCWADTDEDGVHSSGDLVGQTFGYTPALNTVFGVQLSAPITIFEVQ